MNKKILALSILTVLIIGGYVAFYAYSSLYVIPEDVQAFKEDLKAMGEPIPEAYIQEWETLANQIEGGPPLALIPESERIRMANDWRNEFAPARAEADELKQNIAYNSEIASIYDLLLKGDVADKIREVYGDPKLIRLIDDTVKILEDVPINFEKGDNAAIANDLRELARITREMNAWDAQSKPKLEEIIKRLEG